MNRLKPMSADPPRAIRSRKAAATVFVTNASSVAMRLQPEGTVMRCSSPLPASGGATAPQRRARRRAPARYRGDRAVVDRSARRARARRWSGPRPTRIHLSRHETPAMSQSPGVAPGGTHMTVIVTTVGRSSFGTCIAPLLALRVPYLRSGVRATEQPQRVLFQNQWTNLVSKRGLFEVGQPAIRCDQGIV